MSLDFLVVAPVDRRAGRPVGTGDEFFGPGLPGGRTVPRCFRIADRCRVRALCDLTLGDRRVFQNCVGEFDDDFTVPLATVDAFFDHATDHGGASVRIDLGEFVVAVEHGAELVHPAFGDGPDEPFLGFAAEYLVREQARFTHRNLVEVDLRAESACEHEFGGGAAESTCTEILTADRNVLGFDPRPDLLRRLDEHALEERVVHLNGAAVLSRLFLVQDLRCKRRTAESAAN